MTGQHPHYPKILIALAVVVVPLMALGTLDSDDDLVTGNVAGDIVLGSIVIVAIVYGLVLLVGWLVRGARGGPPSRLRR